MMPAFAKAKASALPWCSAWPGWARPTSATPQVMPITPSHAMGDGVSPITAALPRATISGAQPRMMG
jgi:hypothetical protein